MIRSLYSGVTGMKSNQLKMDVIGNNIANVNTTAFKGGRAHFQDMFSQNVEMAQGKINPNQVGLGVNVAAVDNDFAQGPQQPTGRELDFAIEGPGFFKVYVPSAADPTKADTALDPFYTRDGSFVIRGTSLVTAEGYVVAEDAVTFDTATGEIENIDISKFTIQAFQNSGGLEKVGGNRYMIPPDNDNTGTKYNIAPTERNIRQGVLEMSNVDLATEFTEMITTSRAYQANSRTITTSDEMLQELINLKR